MVGGVANFVMVKLAWLVAADNQFHNVSASGRLCMAVSSVLYLVFGEVAEGD